MNQQIRWVCESCIHRAGRMCQRFKQSPSSMEALKQHCKGTEYKAKLPDEHTTTNSFHYWASQPETKFVLQALTANILLMALVVKSST